MLGFNLFPTDWTDLYSLRATLTDRMATLAHYHRESSIVVVGHKAYRTVIRGNHNLRLIKSVGLIL